MFIYIYIYVYIYTYANYIPGCCGEAARFENDTHQMHIYIYVGYIYIYIYIFIHKPVYAHIFISIYLFFANSYQFSTVFR